MYIINNELVNIQDIHQILKNKEKIALSEKCFREVSRCREYLELKISSSAEPFYGINTGFGALYNRKISNEDISTLQKNLVMSHSCGIGEKVPTEIVRIILLLKIISLAKGKSGVSTGLLDRLILFYNNDILPVIYQQGSLGASGDLSPLAHLSLPLIGLGEAFHNGQILSGSQVHELLNIDPITLKSKEGLALLNGTQFMNAYCVWLGIKAMHLYEVACMVAAMSLDAFDGRMDAFHDNVHQLRPYKGQLETARKIREYLHGSELMEGRKDHVQDPYSFRCIPQVHGASRDAIDYFIQVTETEINSVTDNPTIFPEEDMIISAGNFHGQPLALAADFLSIAISELGNISERRIFKLISGQRGLPPFLTKDPGLNSGFMIPQYTAASIVNQNKQLCYPSSVDSIDSSQGQEDHVSMGANASTKAFRVLENTERILAIELLNSAQALSFRRPLKSSAIIEKLFHDFRREVPFVMDDEVMHNLMINSVNFLKNIDLGNTNF